MTNIPEKILNPWEHKQKRIKQVRLAFIIIIVLVISFVTYNQRKEIRNTIDDIVSNINISNAESIFQINPPEYDIIQMGEELHDLINEQRRINGLSILEWDSKLSAIARQHSQDMATRNFFSHNSPEGCDPSCRYERNNYKCHIDLPDSYYIEGGAENIFLNNIAETIYESSSVAEYNTENEIMHSTVNGWMSSPGHRENILTAYWGSEGIGIYIDEDGEVYITQNFC